MNRTAEKVLSIIAVVLTAISTIFGFLGVAIFNMLKNDPAFKEEMTASLLEDPALSMDDVDLFFNIIDMMGGFIWLLIIAMIISIILNIIGIVNIWNNKNAKLAGILFIIAGLFAGILTLPSILLYIAGILCFTKKPPLQDTQYGNAPYPEGDSDSMRPL